MPYKAVRGGHAPGHLREPFLDWVQDFVWGDGNSDLTTVVDQLYPEGARKPIRRSATARQREQSADAAKPYAAEGGLHNGDKKAPSHHKAGVQVYKQYARWPL